MRKIYKLIALLAVINLGLGEPGDIQCRASNASDTISTVLAAKLDEIMADRNSLQSQLNQEKQVTAELKIQLATLRNYDRNECTPQPSEDVIFCNKNVSIPNTAPAKMGVPLWTSTVCENSTLFIRCPGELKLRIMGAAYGRIEGKDVCPYDSIPSKYCPPTDVTGQVANRCNLTSCAMLATKTAFYDGCPGTYKYLEVKYKCMELLTSATGQNYWAED